MYSPWFLSTFCQLPCFFGACCFGAFLDFRVADRHLALVLSLQLRRIAIPLSPFQKHQRQVCPIDRTVDADAADESFLGQNQWVILGTGHFFGKGRVSLAFLIIAVSVDSCITARFVDREIVFKGSTNLPTTSGVILVGLPIFFPPATAGPFFPAPGL